MQRFWAGTKAGAALAALLGWASAACGQTQTFQPDLLFHSLRHGASQVYLADSASGQARRLRASGGEDIDATWSPDGQRLLFTGRSGTNSEVFVANADGSGLRQLTDHPGYDGAARFSPDGRSIAFISSRDGSSKLYLMDADGGKLRRLSRLQEGDETNHSWSPDGRQIAWVAVVNRRMSVWTAAVDGGESARLTSENVNETSPAWSPDGSTVAYLRKVRDSNPELRLQQPGSSSHRALALAFTNMSNLAFSADGQRILFEGVVAGSARSDIHAVPVAGGEPVNLTDDPSEDLAADLSADGRHLAFVSFRHGPVGQVYTLDLAGRALQRIGPSSSHDFRPLWRPVAPGKGA